jgi:hypothetical protein
MDNPRPEQTKGIPWADHNETESSPPDPRREEYGAADPDKTADERVEEEPQRDDEKSDDSAV